jgi:hypothetical protein
MARLARSELFDPREVSTFHCTNRCVRRAYLCGKDPYNGKNYEHRKGWIEKRLEFLAGQFAIDVLDHAILSNHLHLALRNRPDIVDLWDDTEVARRWLMLCPVRKTAEGEPAEPSEAELDSLRHDPDQIQELRKRLSDISWFMRMISERIARWANREDDVTGRFWEGRFKAVKICDEPALVANSVYIDLNVMRARLAKTPETSEFTSVKRRIESLNFQGPPEDRPDAWLAPLCLHERTAPAGPQPSQTGRRASDKGFLPMTAEEYLQLVDWTGRQLPRSCTGRIPEHLPQILKRVDLEPENWLTWVQGFDRAFHRVAGRASSLARLQRRFRPGKCQLLESA